MSCYKFWVYCGSKGFLKIFEFKPDRKLKQRFLHLRFPKTSILTPISLVVIIQFFQIEKHPSIKLLCSKFDQLGY